MIHVLMNTVLPVFLLAGLGWIARRVLKIEVKDLARLVVYCLSPGLVAHGILNAQVGASEVAKIIGFALLLNAIMILLTLGIGRVLGWNRAQASAAVLSTAFMNSANYGLPVVLLAFGQMGFDVAAIFVVIQAVLMFTVAVFFAARGRMSWRDALVSVFRLPLVWAAAVALTVRLLGVPLPEAVLRPIALLSNGAIVMAVLLLGMQIAGIQIRGAHVRIAVAAALRLVFSPVVGLLLVSWLRPEPITAKVMVLLSAMPTAVSTTLLAVQFDAEPQLVSGVTMVTTLFSLVTVTFWIWFLQ